LQIIRSPLAMLGFELKDRCQTLKFLDTFHISYFYAREQPYALHDTSLKATKVDALAISFRQVSLIVAPKRGYGDLTAMDSRPTCLSNFINWLRHPPFNHL